MVAVIRPSMEPKGDSVALLAAEPDSLNAAEQQQSISVSSGELLEPTTAPSQAATTKKSEHFLDPWL